MSQPVLAAAGAGVNPDTATALLALAAVAVTVGAIAGLLANSGGFLLAPLYIAVFRLPVATTPTFHTRPDRRPVASQDS